MSNTIVNWMVKYHVNICDKNISDIEREFCCCNKSLQPYSTPDMKTVEKIWYLANVRSYSTNSIGLALDISPSYVRKIKCITKYDTKESMRSRKNGRPSVIKSKIWDEISKEIQDRQSIFNCPTNKEVQTFI